jgi:transposase
MEACGSAHRWARVLGALGHQVELLPARQVRPFVRSNKDDAADARAIALALHRTRQHWVSVRTATINALRGALYEFGVTLPGGKRVGLKALATHRAEIDAKVPATIQRLIDGQLATLKDIGCRIDKLEAEIGMQLEQLDNAATLREVPGIGLLGATAFAATLGDGKAWKSGREFSASLGLVPAHRGTGASAADTAP